MGSHCTASVTRSAHFDIRPRPPRYGFPCLLARILWVATKDSYIRLWFNPLSEGLDIVIFGALSSFVYPKHRPTGKVSNWDYAMAVSPSTKKIILDGKLQTAPMKRYTPYLFVLCCFLVAIFVASQVRIQPPSLHLLVAE